MKLIRFRIKNYKSVIDSGFCTLASDLTILIGKNESGKTSVLEALRDFDREVGRFSAEVYPLDGRPDEPSVEMHFQISSEELKAIQQEAGVSLDQEIRDRILKDGLILCKDGQGRYSFADEALEAVGLGSDQGGQAEQAPPPLTPLKTAKEKLFELLQGHHLPDINLTTSPQEIQKTSKEVVRNVKGILTRIQDEGLQHRIVEHLRGFIKEVETLGGVEVSRPLTLANYFAQRVPHFIFFNEFSDVLPFEIPIARLKENRAVCDFAKVAGLDLDQVMAVTDLQKRINLLNRHSAGVSGDFLNYWEQNKVEIIVKPEADKLLFGVRDCETTNFFKVEQRSKGFQWFLSFYLRLQAEAGPNNIIIIDEPGTNLHALAQKELIQILVDKIAPASQVVFSTHSPYLIDPERQDRVRLVQKDSAHGTLLREISDAAADEETLHPLLTARGADQAQPLIEPGSHNVIVQCTSMYYYFKAITALIPNELLSDVNFVPGTDQVQIMRLASLMLGQDSDFIVLLEPNAYGRKIAQSLQEKFGLDDDRFVFISEEEDVLTEDLFAREDFHAFILNAAEDSGGVDSNSDHLRSREMNKVLTAKAFLDKVRKDQASVELSEKTVAAFQMVYQKMLASLGRLPEPEQPPAPEEPAAEETPESAEPEQEAKAEEAAPERRRSFLNYLKERM